MKIRNGFVSNSSSSSFIAVGFTKDDIEATVDTSGFTDQEWDQYYDKFYIDSNTFGKIIDTEIEYSSIKSISFEELNKCIEEVIQKAKEYNIEIDHSRIRFLYGERAQ